MKCFVLYFFPNCSSYSVFSYQWSCSSWFSIASAFCKSFLPSIPAQVPDCCLFLFPLIFVLCNRDVGMVILQGILHRVCCLCAGSSGEELQTASERNPRLLTMQEIVNLDFFFPSLLPPPSSLFLSCGLCFFLELCLAC